GERARMPGGWTFGRSVVGQRPRPLGDDLVALHSERDPEQRPPARRSRDALAGLRAVVRTVRRALEDAAVLAEELVLDPVEAHRDVPAPVHVGMKLTGIIQDEALDLLVAPTEEELLRLARTELADARDRDAHARTTRR